MAAVMELIRLLGALLLALELAAGTTRPDVGIPPVNLSCYKCFKMLSSDQCAPVRCQPQDSVCISLIVLIYSSELWSAVWPGGTVGVLSPTAVPSISGGWIGGLEDWRTPHPHPSCCVATHLIGNEP